jgi:hypothetical protein
LEINGEIFARVFEINDGIFARVCEINRGWVFCRIEHMSSMLGGFIYKNLMFPYAGSLLYSFCASE